MREKKRKKRDGRIDLSCSERDRRCTTSIQSNYNLCMSRTELVGGWFGAFVRFNHPRCPRTPIAVMRFIFLWRSTDSRYEWIKMVSYHPAATIAFQLKPHLRITHTPSKKACKSSLVFHPRPPEQKSSFLISPTIEKKRVKTKQRKRKCVKFVSSF